MRVLIAPDKFKGTLSAARVAQAIAAGWRSARPSDTLTLLPISDGGDGFGIVLKEILGATTIHSTTTDAAGQPRRAQWWWVADQKLAIIEAAQANGLALLPKGLHHPFDLDTSGVAPLIRAALKKAARRCIVGVGGSATNDGGFGLAQALGWCFLDPKGTPIVRWTDLARLARLEPPEARLRKCQFIVATDVENPLLGSRGATRIYGPQKGLLTRDLPQAEKCLRRLALVVQRQLGINAATPGSGAAGGLGFGMLAFLGAKRRLGFDVFAEYARLDHRLRTTDLVITGEGSFDRQSVMGKGVGQWIERCAKQSRPVIVLAGQVAPDAAKASRTVRWSMGLTDITSTGEALDRPAFWLRRLARKAALNWDAPPDE